MSIIDLNPRENVLLPDPVAYINNLNLRCNTLVANNIKEGNGNKTYDDLTVVNRLVLEYLRPQRYLSLNNDKTVSDEILNTISMLSGQITRLNPFVMNNPDPTQIDYYEIPFTSLYNVNFSLNSVPFTRFMPATGQGNFLVNLSLVVSSTNSCNCTIWIGQPSNAQNFGRLETVLNPSNSPSGAINDVLSLNCIIPIDAGNQLFYSVVFVMPELPYTVEITNANLTITYLGASSTFPPP